MKQRRLGMSAGVPRERSSTASLPSTGTRYPALALDPSTPQTVFVGANETQGGLGGLFKSTDDGQSWKNFCPNTVPISSAVVAADGTIYAGTVGQGVWRYGK